MLTEQDKHRWESIGKLELNLRRLVADALIQEYGARAWDDGIPGDTCKRISKNVQDHQGRCVDDVPDLEERLQECDIGGLYEIISSRWKVVFSKLIGIDKALWDMQSDVVKRARNSLDHYRREILPSGEEDTSLRPLFDIVVPQQTRTVLVAMAKRNLTCLEPSNEELVPNEREEPLTLQRRDYIHFVGRNKEISQIIYCMQASGHMQCLAATQEAQS